MELTLKQINERMVFLAKIQLKLMDYRLSLLRLDNDETSEIVDGDEIGGFDEHYYEMEREEFVQAVRNIIFDAYETLTEKFGLKISNSNMVNFDSMKPSICLDDVFSEAWEEKNKENMYRANFNCCKKQWNLHNFMSFIFNWKMNPYMIQENLDLINWNFKALVEYYEIDKLEKSIS